MKTISFTDQIIASNRAQKEYNDLSEICDKLNDFVYTCSEDIDQSELEKHLNWLESMRDMLWIKANKEINKLLKIA